MAERGVSFLAVLFIVLLCILIVISVFVSAYFGYLNIGGSVKGSANLENPFGITNWIAKTSLGDNGGVGFEIENKGFEPYYISSVEVSDCNSENNNREGWQIREHERLVILVKCTSNNALKKGDMIKKDLIITYKTTQSTLKQTSKGFIKTQVSD